MDNSLEILPGTPGHLTGKWKRPEVLEAVFDHLSEAIFLYDNSLHITGANSAAGALFGTDPDELTGRHCREVFRCANCDGSCAISQGLREVGRLASGTVNLHLKNGRERMFVVKTVQIPDGEGGLEGVVATVKDVTSETEPARNEIVGESQAMQDLLRFVRRVAASEAASILIEGENGTGKDIIAKTLHYQSLRQAEPFLAINCAAIPETLLESELFGYEKGAFTDARAQKRGLFELAHKGTLFLDEVGEMPLSIQAKLLRVLEEQCFRRLGGLSDIHVDIRIVAATNKNLREAVNQGAFRQDLYYRLNVIQLVVPPLRERPQDILPLARFFIDHYNRKFKQNIEGFSPPAETLLLSYGWPGNVRELRNAIERSMILEDTPRIRPSSLPIALLGAKHRDDRLPVSAPDENPMSLSDQERRLLVQALERCRGNQSQAARLLKITRDTLRYKMKKYGLH
jgi:PAS domain S-box-containing protein